MFRIGVVPDEWLDYGSGMAGAVAIVVVLLVFPSLVLMSGGVASAIVGFFLQRDGEIRHQGSELVALDD